MRISLLFFILIFFTAFGSIKNQKINYTPPGTVLIMDSLFMDKLEISNKSWKEFMNFERNGKLRDSSEVETLQPDSTITLRIKGLGKIKMAEYFNNPSFDDYPIVGVSYDQVVKFCSWRSLQVNLLIKKGKNEPGLQIEYRLPSIQEWEFIAKNKLDTTSFPFGQDVYYTIDDVKYRAFNCYYPEKPIPNYIRACNDTIGDLKANNYGIYNLIGNVCEMVQESGLAKGGHYEATLENCKVKETYTFSSPNKWLGFRCICLVNKQLPILKGKKTNKG